MATGRFRSPKTEKEEIALLSEMVPKNMKYNTKWVVDAFTSWQNARVNKKRSWKRVNQIKFSKDLHQKLMNTN